MFSAVWHIFIRHFGNRLASSLYFDEEMYRPGLVFAYDVRTVVETGTQ